MIKIHNFARGARGVRVFWVCEEMGLPYQVETVAFPPNDAYCAKHSLGSVPFLEDDGGVAVHESVAMMLYLTHKYGPTPLLPGNDDPTLARVLQMTVFGETTIGAGINPLLGAHFVAPESEKRNWSVQWQEARVEQALRYVVEVLGDRPFLAGNELTLADISVSCALGIWNGALGKPMAAELLTYRERLAARPAYQRAQKAQQG